MNLQQFEKKDFWRALILYGRNVATYKIALGHCLVDFVKQGKTNVTMEELSNAFFDLYYQRLQNGKPQLSNPNRKTVMERAVENFKIGKMNRTQVIDYVKKEAFNDVLPRFHVLEDITLPVKFYEQDSKGLILYDDLFEVFTNDKNILLLDELGSRWDLLEAAFEMKMDDSELVNTIREFYLKRGYDRTGITKTRPVLNGYQNDVCFYCGEIMGENDVHVDHVIPRQLVNHDEIWNLALAHSFCNQQKSDSLPTTSYIYKLIERNEHLISSNHPIKQKLVDQLGKTSEKRRRHILNVYDDAKIVIKYTWEGIKGYNPETDLFYKTFIRSITK